jgi:hypothetical protein
MNEMDMTGLALRLAEEWDVPQLHRLVHSAYHELANRGLNLTGTYQDEHTTRARVVGNEVFLVCQDEEVVATVS